MQSTAQKILTQLQLKQEHNGEWRGNSPFREGSDSKSFKLTIHDGEHGAWFDHVSQEQGSLYELAERLNIETPKNGRVEVESSKRDYHGLADYAASKGVPSEVFTRYRWREVDHQNRPALAFDTHTGTRYRFLDNKEPRYISPIGYVRSWYGLQQATRIASNQKTAIILCNGEASTVVAQHYGLPAFAVAGGSEKAIPEDLLKSLLEQWRGPIWVALDCDNAGQQATELILKQLPKAQGIDLMLGQGGDLADFCKLHQKAAMDAIKRMAQEQRPKNEASAWVNVKPITMADTASNMIARLEEDSVQEGKILTIPFKVLHPCRGFARRISPRKCIGVIAASGGGKTSFLETFVDNWLMRGEYGFYDGAEWSPDEYMQRRVARYSYDREQNGTLVYQTVTVEDQMDYELWKQEADNGIPEDRREGKRLTEAQENSVIDISTRVRRWRGGLEYIPDEAFYLEDKLDYLSYRIGELAKDGIRPSFAVWDYVQLYHVREQPSSNGDNSFQYALWLIKKWSERENMVSVFASQITKDGTRQGRKDQVITSDMARYVRDDYANLFLSLQIVHREDSGPEYNDENPAPLLRVMDNKTGYLLGKIYIGKNSMGMEGITLPVYADFARLRWVDQRWHSDDVQMRLLKPNLEIDF